ncbi:MAG: hypothetical protein KFB95_06250 [Simkaniaceae bacterium]|nr:MAG: hypothetical protein KFB95_06250 [Simkaniaceae bacterium]
MITNLFNAGFSYVQSFFLSPSPEERMQQVRENFSLESRASFAKELNPKTFTKRLLFLVGTQDETEAICLVAKAYLVVKESPELLEVDGKKILDFRDSLPEESLARGRSFGDLSNTLNLRNLSDFFKYVESQSHLRA